MRMAGIKTFTSNVVNDDASLDNLLLFVILQD